MFKVLVALEFHAQADAGVLDTGRMADLDPSDRTAGPTGLSTFDDPARMPLRDLCRLMMSISDNTATDLLMRFVGPGAVNARARTCGCHATVVESDLRTLFDQIAADIGFNDYGELLAAQSGALGPDARARSIDPARVDACRALDPMRTTRSTPRDMTRLLKSIWRDEAASPTACANVRAVMAQQVSTRLGRALPDGATLAAKTGSLFSRVRNEVGVVTHADGRAFTVAVFTWAREPFARVGEIEGEMARAGKAAVGGQQFVAVRPLRNRTLGN